MRPVVDCGPSTVDPKSQRAFSSSKPICILTVLALGTVALIRTAEAQPLRLEADVAAPHVSELMSASAPYDLISTDGARLVVRFLAPAGTQVVVHLRSRRVDVSGDAEVVHAQTIGGDVALTLAISGAGVVTFDAQPRALTSERWTLEVRDVAWRTTD